MANKYRKKPVVIEAVQFVPGDKEKEAELLAHLEGSTGWRVTNELGMPAVEIETLEGKLRASPNDWIIKGVKGEYYPCKPDIFEATYERAD